MLKGSSQGELGHEKEEEAKEPIRENMDNTDNALSEFAIMQDEIECIATIERSNLVDGEAQSSSEVADAFQERIESDKKVLEASGILYKDKGRLVEAAESYRKALEADSSYKSTAECLSIVLTDIGTSLKLASNTQEGIQKYYDAIKIYLHYAPAYYNLGVVYCEMMQFDTALNCYEKAAFERPMYAESYCNMGSVPYDIGNGMQLRDAGISQPIPTKCEKLQSSGIREKYVTPVDV